MATSVTARELELRLQTVGAIAKAFLDADEEPGEQAWETVSNICDVKLRKKKKKTTPWECLFLIVFVVCLCAGVACLIAVVATSFSLFSILFGLGTFFFAFYVFTLWWDDNERLMKVMRSAD